MKSKFTDKQIEKLFEDSKEKLKSQGITAGELEWLILGIELQALAAEEEVAALNNQLNKVYAEKAEEKLRADQMTLQHDMQCKLRKGLEVKLEAYTKRLHEACDYVDRLSQSRENG